MSMQPLTCLERASITVATHQRGLLEITDRVRACLGDSGLVEGMAHLFVHHTSCSLIISENADPVVCADLGRFFERLVPDGDSLFRHTAEGPDDMSGHVRSVLTATTLSIPVTGGKLDLGTWQGIFLWEHRTHPHERRVTMTFIGHGAN